MSGSEILLYIGIIIMVVSAISAAVLAVIFAHRKQQLKKILEQEYGSLRE